MTIDDNTIYGLTGSQIKELPAKMNVVTVGQLNGVIDAINTALSTNISHIES